MTTHFHGFGSLAEAQKLIALFYFIARAALCGWYLGCLGDGCIHGILWLMVMSAHITHQELKQINPMMSSSRFIFIMIFHPCKQHMMYILDYLPAISYISNSKYCCFGSLLGWAFYSTLFEIDLLGIASYVKPPHAISLRSILKRLFVLMIAWLQRLTNTVIALACFRTLVNTRFLQM